MLSYQVVIIVTSFYFAYDTISTSVEDWKQNPKVTSIKRVSLPLKQSSLPAITICDGDKTFSDNWALSEIFFNFFMLGPKSPISFSLDRNYLDSNDLTKDFKSLLSQLFEKVSNWVDNELILHILFNEKDYSLFANNENLNKMRSIACTMYSWYKNPFQMHICTKINIHHGCNFGYGTKKGLLS